MSGRFTERTHILLSKEQSRFLSRLKEQKGESIGYFIREAINEYARARGVDTDRKKA
jgi:predicted DNA-binding protein